MNYELNMFDMIDATGSGYKNDPRMRDVEAEMIRSHALCLKISAKKPTDPDYKSLLEEQTLIIRVCWKNCFNVR